MKRMLGYNKKFYIKKIWEWETPQRLLVAAERPPKTKIQNNLLSYNLELNEIYKRISKLLVHVIML